MTSHEKAPWWRRMRLAIVPEIPDFTAMLQAQASNLCTTISALTKHLASPSAESAAEINRLVDEGHHLRDITLGALYGSFITPIDREDIYRIAIAIDHVLDYLKNTIREVEVLQVEPDAWMERMTATLGEGCASLSQALSHFSTHKGASVAGMVKTRGAERRVEDMYRDALRDMFQGEQYTRLAEAGASTTAIECLDFVLSRMKRREVYRHLSNAADRLAHAGEALRDVSIKYDDGDNETRT